MTNLSIQTFTGLLQNQPTQLINARDLHDFLQIQTPFHKWIQRRISDYDFAENLDFTVTDKFVRLDRGIFGMRDEAIKEYHITLDMAKELCMLERSQLGQQARRYFIQKEKEALALRNQLPKAETTISTAEYIDLLKTQNAYLKQQLGTAKPTRKANIPLSQAEKSQILQLSASGLSKSQIAAQLNRSPSAVRAVIREA